MSDIFENRWWDLDRSFRPVRLFSIQFLPKPFPPTPPDAEEHGAVLLLFAPYDSPPATPPAACRPGPTGQPVRVWSRPRSPYSRRISPHFCPSSGLIGKPHWVSYFFSPGRHILSFVSTTSQRQICPENIPRDPADRPLMLCMLRSVPSKPSPRCLTVEFLQIVHCAANPQSAPTRRAPVSQRLFRVLPSVPTFLNSGWGGGQSASGGAEGLPPVLLILGADPCTR